MSTGRRLGSTRNLGKRDYPNLVFHINSVMLGVDCTCESRLKEQMDPSPLPLVTVSRWPSSRSLSRQRSTSAALATIPVDATGTNPDEANSKECQSAPVERRRLSGLIRRRTETTPKRPQLPRTYSARDKREPDLISTQVSHSGGAEAVTQNAAASIGSKTFVEITQKSVLLKSLSRSSLQAPSASFFTAAIAVASISNTMANVNEDAASRQHEEMMERFQVRRLQHTLSSTSVSGERGREDGFAGSRTTKVVPVDTETAQLSRQTGYQRSISSHTKKEAVNTAPAPHVTTIDSQSPTIPVAPVIKPRSSVQKHQDQTAMNTENSSRKRLSIYRIMATSRRRTKRKLRRFLKRISSPMSPFSTAASVRTTVLLMAFLLHVVCFPIEKAFFTSVPSWFSHTEYLASLLYLLDFLMAFNTSFQDKRGVLVTSRQEIVWNYVRGWCIPDLLGALPIFLMLDLDKKPLGHPEWSHVLLDGIVNVQRLLHVVRVVRLIWMIRVSKSSKSIWAWLIYSRYSHLLRIFWIMLLLVLIAHYVACTWKLLSDDVGVTDKQSVIEQYAGNFYDALQLLQGQGLETHTATQSVFASFSVLLGSIVLAIVFGNVAMLVSNFNANSTNYQRKMESVFAIMSKLQLPVLLRERIHQYYEHLWREYESLDGELVKFSKGLTHNLSLEVVLFKYMDLVLNVPFWRNCTPDFQKQIALSLQVRVYLPDDFILRRGEVGDEFYMINRGNCELSLGPDSFEHATPPLPPRSGNDSRAGSTAGGYARSTYNNSNRELADGEDESGFDNQHRSTPDQWSGTKKVKSQTKLLVRGQAFGEIALLMNIQRTADVRAVTYVEMCVLSRAAFQQILTRNPGDRKTALSNILATCMQHNENRGIYCPLKQTVATVLQEIGKTGNEITARYGAAVIAAVVNPDGDTGNVTIGMGKNMKDEVRRLKEYSEHLSEPAMTGSPDQREDSSNSRSDTSDLHSEVNLNGNGSLDARVRRIENAQLQTLQSLQEIRSIMAAIRRTAAEPKPLDGESTPVAPIRPQTVASATPHAGSVGASDADADTGVTKDHLLRIANRREPFVRNRSLTAPLLMEPTQPMAPELGHARNLTCESEANATNATRDAPIGASSDKVTLRRLTAPRRSATLQDFTLKQKPQAFTSPSAVKRAPLRAPFKLRSSVTKRTLSSEAKRNSSSGNKARHLLQRMGSIVSFTSTPAYPPLSPTCYADQLFNTGENLPVETSVASD